MTKRLVILFLVAFFISTQGVSQEIVSGPMVCHTTMTTANIWLQLDETAEIEIIFGADNQTTNSLIASEENAFVVKTEISDLLPGTVYEYQIKVNGQIAESAEQLSFSTQTLWQFREDPPAFKVALGSCTYINEERFDRPGEPYGRGYRIFNSIADKSPDMMLWLGDNIYLREPDWTSRSGYLHRYSHTRQIPEIQKLLRTGQHYAIWDDHDFGPNDANGSWLYKDIALETFELFWGNPTTGTPDIDGITTAFSYNDIEFYLLDNRYHRTSGDLENGDPEILGKEQIDWLIENLKFSRSPFKMVAIGGQVINTVKKYENYAVYAEERKYLLRRITEEKIRGVIFLTGDKHHTELSHFTSENGIDIYDLTVSPLTSKSYSAEDETNKLRINGTAVSTQNFGLLEFSGPRKERQMKISIFDSAGAEIWTQTLKSK